MFLINMVNFGKEVLKMRIVIDLNSVDGQYLNYARACDREN